MGAADVEAVSLNFVLPPSDQDRYVYLRIKSISSYLVYVEAMPLTVFERTERTDNLIYTGYVMLTLILAVWLFITWMMNRERVIGAFTLQQFMAFLHTFTKVGFARAFLDRYISDGTIDGLSNLIVVTYPLIGLIANRLLLQEYGLKRGFRFGFNTIIFCSLGIIVFFFSGHEVKALNINVTLVLVMMVFFWICAIFATDQAQASAASNAVQLNALRVFYSFNLLVWLMALLPLLGIVSTGSLALHSLFVYNMMSSLVFFCLLQYRARWLLRYEVARASTLKAEASQERQRREEQSMLMAMLSHEIKTPLSVLKLVMDEKVAGSDLEGHANRAVGNIDFIVNRCLQLGKLDARAIQINSTTFSVRELIGALLQDCHATNRVELHVPDGLVIDTDKDIFRMVVSNLLENSLKYGAADSPIELEVVAARKEAVEGVRVLVRNAVGPLGAPDAGQVFKKYYRNTQATKITGSGLGLFLVHELVGVMGGDVTYASDQQEVIFSVWIPV
jgi:signal transduction histidine kinase